MKAYASRTGSRRQLILLRAAGWRLMLSPAGVLRTESFPYALDNGAWSAYRAGTAFDALRFHRAVEKFGAAADFIVCPDIVCGGLASLDFSLTWQERLTGCAPLYLPVQDGMTREAVTGVLPRFDGLFVGGSDAFKSTTRLWAELAQAHHKRVHVGRVNTLRRLRMVYDAGADSIDGSGVSRFAHHATLMIRGLYDLHRQEHLWDPTTASSYCSAVA